MKKKLAIIGSGVSAMTCAYYLRDRFEITIFEKNDYLGGHTHTHLIKEGENSFTIDTGFIVFNEATYPNMLKLFAELGVKKQKSNMSFAVYNQASGLQYCGSSFALLFAQWQNIFSPRHWRFLLEIDRFFKAALKDKDKVRGSRETIESYCKRQGLSDYFIENYLAPMSSAVWSVPQSEIRDFPISLLLPFFYNHGLLGMDTHHQWYTVQGGSNDYIKKIETAGHFQIHLSEPVETVVESSDRVLVKTAKREEYFDFAVLASHADQSLRIASGLSEERQAVLKAFTYNHNRAVLHTDVGQMPPLRKVWSSWNHVLAPDGRSSTLYYVNPLQSPPTKTDYFVSINPFSEIAKDKIIKEIDYEHPDFTVENFALQDKLREQNKGERIILAGAYFGYGFHEDGVKSGVAAANLLETKA
jgi:predicted NAD/FAD-binding protein